MASIWKRALQALLLAGSAPYLYDRYLALGPMLANRPGSLTPVYNIKSHEIRFRDRIRNCEDVLLDEGMGIAILSCDPGRDVWNTVMGTFLPEKGITSGRLWLYDYSHPDLPDDELLKPFAFKNFPNEDDFHPLGIDFESETSTLYVVSHAQSGSAIEVFKIEVGAATATHVQTFKHPLIHTPNSIHALGDGKFYVTNDHYFRAAISPILSKIETFSGLPAGSVVYSDLYDPDSTKIVERVPFANGITMLNSSTLAVASTSKAGVYFFEVQPNYDLKSKGYVRTPAAVDNLSVDSSGRLLLAGHPFALTVTKVSARRPNCNPDSDVEEERKACDCDAPSWAAEWSEEGGLRTLYQGLEFCSSTMAVRDRARGVGIVSGLYEKGVMVFSE